MTVLYGIKNCDSVKKARRWLEDNDVTYRFHDFRADGLDKSMVTAWLEQQDVEKLVNKRSTTWKQLSDSEKDSLDKKSAPSLCAKYETLIKRPVLEHNGEIHIGFNEKIYQQLFNA